MTVPSTPRRSVICPVLGIIILVDYLIPFQWSNCQKVAWFKRLSAWQHKVYPEIIGTVQREMLTSTFNLPQAC
jgi:hypothetical protein